MGTSTAYVYDKNGEVECFDACTYPSDIKKYATVPGKLLEAQVGIHNVNSTDENRKYTALRMSEVGTENFYGNYINLGEPNPSNPSTNFAYGINIHKPLLDNRTGFTNSSPSVPASKGCFMIDRNSWGNFISTFDANAKIGIIVSRVVRHPDIVISGSK